MLWCEQNTSLAHDFTVLHCEQNMSLAHNCSVKKKHHLHTTAVWTKHVICTQLQCEQSMSFAHNHSVNKACHLHTATAWTKHVICTQLHCDSSLCAAWYCEQNTSLSHNYIVKRKKERKKEKSLKHNYTVNKTCHLHTTSLYCSVNNTNQRHAATIQTANWENCKQMPTSTGQRKQRGCFQKQERERTLGWKWILDQCLGPKNKKNNTRVGLGMKIHIRSTSWSCARISLIRKQKMDTGTGPAFKPNSTGPAFKPNSTGPAFKPNSTGPAFKPITSSGFSGCPNR